MSRALIIVIGLLFSRTVLLAGDGHDENDHLFTSSTANLINGNYTAALAGYKKIEQGGDQTASLYSNMGDLYFKTHQWGKAVLYFEKGLLWSPLDTQLIHNNNMVLKGLNNSDYANNLEYYSDNLYNLKTIDKINKLAISGLFISGLALMFFYLLNKRKLLFKRVSKVVVAISLLSILLCSIFSIKSRLKKYAIIGVPKASLHLGPSALSKTSVLLDEGYKVEIINYYKNWFEIKDHANKCGWIYANDLFVIAKTPLDK